MALRETIAPDTVEGNNFRDLLSQATGKDFGNITSNDVKEWAASQGFRNKDVRKITRGFNKFSKRGGDFVLTGEGEFDVAGAGNVSTRRTGNVKGFDVGDILGAGRDVSRLAGALETVAIQPQEEIQDFVPGASIQSDVRSLIEGFGDPIDTTLTGIKDKGASGQKGQQQLAQDNQQRHKDASSLQTPSFEGIGELGIDPNLSIPPSSLGRDFLSGNILGRGIDLDNLGDSPKVGTNPPADDLLGEPRESRGNLIPDRPEGTTSLAEDLMKRVADSGFGRDVGKFFDNLNRTLDSPNVESSPVGSSFGDALSGVDDFLGSNIRDSAFGELISDINPAGLFIPGRATKGLSNAKRLKQAIKIEKKAIKTASALKTETLATAKKELASAKSAFKAGKTGKVEALATRRAKALELAREGEFKDILRPSLNAGIDATVDINITKGLKQIPTPKTIASVSKGPTPKIGEFSPARSLASELAGNPNAQTIADQVRKLQSLGRKSGVLKDGTRVRLKKGQWEVFRFGGKMSKFSSR